MFIFRLNGNPVKWTTSYSSLNIWVNAHSAYSDMIDFGYNNALQFESYNNGTCYVKYTKSYDFYADPTNVDLGVPTTLSALIIFEVYEVNF